MAQFTIYDVIREINSAASFSMEGNTYEGITWLNGTTAISSEDIDAKKIEMEEEWDLQEYARNRKAEYDALNQFELISDDSINGTTTHKDAIVAIKTKYPKG